MCARRLQRLRHTFNFVKKSFRSVRRKGDFLLARGII